MRLIAIRTEPGLAATCAAARAMGLDIEGHALACACPLEWSAPDRGAFDAILAGSAHVFRLGGERLDALKPLAVHAVGERTAQAAQRAGFEVASIGAGGLQTLVDGLAPKPIRLLRLAGEEHVALRPPRHVTISTCMLYRIERRAIGAALAHMLRRASCVLLHSAASAHHFREECERLGIDRGAIAIAALGPRIAAAAGEGWNAVHIAPAPNDAALLAMARGLCNEWQARQTGGGALDR